GWEIPKHIPQEEIGIIILRRDIEKVAASTHRTQSGPFNDLGRDWIIYPNGNNLVPPPLSAKRYGLLRKILKIIWKLTGNTGIKKYPVYFKECSLKLIEWYYHETYALAEKYKKKFPNIKFLEVEDRKSTRLNSSHVKNSYAVFCLKKKKKEYREWTM